MAHSLRGESFCPSLVIATSARVLARPGARLPLSQVRVMSDCHNPLVDRRHIICALIGATVATEASAASVAVISAKAQKNCAKREARYQAHSADVQAFYRTCRLPAK
jgi:hypothetical protein